MVRVTREWELDPRRLKPITEKMKKDKELAYQEVSYYGRLQKRPIALRSVNLSKFSTSEINLIRTTVQKFWKNSATEVSDQSHLFMGWKVAEERETIPYSTALVGYRQPAKSEREYGLSLQALATEHLRAQR